MEKVQKILLVTSVLLFFKSLLSFFCCRYILFVPNDIAFVVAAIPFVLGILIVINKKKITTYIYQNLFANYQKEHILYYLLTAIAFIGIYLTIVSTFLLSNTILWQDDWRIFNDYLFRKNLVDSILDRQNGHLFIIPNIIFLINYYLFDAKEIWLILLNNTALLVITALLTTNLYKTIKGKVIPIINITGCAILALSIFWLASSVMLFWGIGIHNNVAALGTTFAAYALSKQKQIGYFKSMLFFVMGATVSSCCFGAGAATWVLGCVSAILLRRNYKIIFSYFLVGLLGGFLTVGYYTMTHGSGSIKFELTSFIQSIPTFLGAPFIQLLTSFEPSSLIIIATAIGAIGLIILLVKSFFVWKADLKPAISEDNRSLNGMVFHLLLAFFAVAGVVLISLGRVGENVAVAFHGQYHSWSVIFWNGLLATSIIFISYFQKSKLKKITLASFLSITLFGLFFFNLKKIDLRVGDNNSVISYQTDLMVHPDTTGKEIFLWRGDLNSPRFNKVILNVASHLKKERKNIYAQKWTHWIGKDFATEFATKRQVTFTNLLVANEIENNDIIIKGWIFPTSTFQSAPANIVVVYDGKIIGVGVPFSDSNKRRPPINASISNAFNLLPKPFNTFPGVSNYYYMQINKDILNEGVFEEKELFIYGVYPDNSYSKIDSFIPI